jgi:polyisoprenoid-binding protein YceI
MATEMTTGTRLTTDTQADVGKRTIWEIDAKHSLVEFAVKHLMLTTVGGRFTRLRGTIVCEDEADPSRASVEAEIDVASIDTGDPERDAHLRAPDFLDVEKYPTITFKSTRIERVTQDELCVIGDLTIRGVTREVVLDTTYNGRGMNPWGQEVAGFTAEAQINRNEFGLTWNVALEAGGLLVGDKLNVLIEVQAVKKG